VNDDTSGEAFDTVVLIVIALEYNDHDWRLDNLGWAYHSL